MSAKKPNNWHAKALSAFQNGLITREEYKDCIKGNAYIAGCCLIYYLSGGLRKQRVNIHTRKLWS